MGTVGMVYPGVMRSLLKNGMPLQSCSTQTHTDTDTHARARAHTLVNLASSRNRIRLRLAQLFLYFFALISFFSDQCKEIEENNRMGKTSDLVKKIRDTKGTFHAKMGSIKDRNGMDLTEAEDIKKR